MTTATVGPMLALNARTARELMTANPVSILADATLHEALVLFVDRGIKAAPVIDAAGRPVGVLSSTDILIHDREATTHVPRAPEFYTHTDLELATGEHLPRGFEVEKVERTCVADLMTPIVFGVAPDVPAIVAVREMLTRRIHRLFVIDHAGVLVGVISAFDVLRHLDAV